MQNGFENSNDPWKLLKSGDVRRAISQMQDGLAREQSASQIMRLGVAYLYVHKYAEGWEHFRNAIATYPRTMDSFFGMAGIAKWCMGKPEEAVQEWHAGLKAEYADTAGLGVQMPLMLFCAAVLNSNVFQKASAEEILLKKTKDSRIDTWHGPIARRVLGQITEEEFRGHCNGFDEHDTINRHWRAEFYEALLALSKGNSRHFLQSMRKLVDTSQPEWAEHRFFLARMWSEEYFLARYEGGKKD